MLIFINDVPVRILKTDETPDLARINHVLDTQNELITQAKLIHHAWIKNASEKEIDLVLTFLNSKVPTTLLSLLITVKDYESAKSYFKSKFKIVKAAGGIIRKKDKFLMIYRMKKWDLPKGKKEKKEKYRQTAVREVAEECNITVKIGKKVCTSWHTYTMNKRAMLKKTRWYAMDSIDDSRMQPSTEEDIEEVRWMSPKEVYHALEHSYKSISYVLEQYYAQTEVRSSK